ncbi:shikimate kinase [Paractinoplanes brasiliensis]|uniref:shikimate kinase n=1 Tax=Paractinoplanes brasiliensis TaxID=52695 RepID=UPI0019445CD0|nr:shikimate kinase [Actinoplanes brasiliensis]
MADDVIWVGGGSGAGKSTVARRLAAKHGLHLYDTDAVMAGHAARCDPVSSPHLAAFLRMSMDERWLRPPEVMLETFHWFRGEGFDLILDDLARHPKPVIAEGFRLLPALVPRPARAVWLLPASQFRRAAFDSRGSTWQIASRTSDPPRALANLLERDRLFTERLRAETRALGLATVDVQPGMTVDELTVRVEKLTDL